MADFIAFMFVIWICWWPESIGEIIAKVRKGYDAAMANDNNNKKD